MLDDKILDRARRLIKSRFAERRNALPNEVLRRMRTHDLHSSPTWNSVRAACEEEISTKAKIVWDSIQEVHKALGSPIKETEMLRADLKEEASQHIEIAVSEASELMKKYLSSMKPSVRLFDLGNTRHEVIERISVKIDLYVDSLLCRPAETESGIEPLKKGGQMNTLEAYKKEYENVLLEIAREVYSHVFGDNRDKSLLRRLRKALREIAAQGKKHREYMKGLYDQAQKSGEIFVVTSDMKIPDAYKCYVSKYFRIDRKVTPPLEKMPFGIFCPDGIPRKIVKRPTELNKREAKNRNLIGLACIYDNHSHLFGAIKENKINDYLIPEDTYRLIWKFISDEASFYEGKDEFWKTALDSIRPKRKPEGAKQEIADESQTQIEDGQGSDGNISGMRWQEAQEKAKKIIAESGFRGFMKLKTAVGCKSKKTLRKAIDNSKELTEAEKQYNAMSGTLKAVGLTPKVLATYKEKSEGPELSEVEVDEILAEMLKQVKEDNPAMLEKTKKQINNMIPTEKYGLAKAYQKEYKSIQKHNRKNKDEKRTFFSESQEPHQHKKA